MDTWTCIDILEPGAPLIALRDLWGSDDGQHIVVVGDGGSAFVSRDGGATWVTARTNVQIDLHQLAADAQGRLYAVGSNASASVLLRSTDGGMRWSRLKIGRRPWLRTLAVIGDLILVIGSREFLRSLDGGRTFEVLHRDHYNSHRALWGQRADRLFAIGYNTIALTTDGGERWRHTPHEAPAHLSALDGDGQRMWAVGAANVLRSTDGGESWTTLIPTDYNLGANDVLAAAPDDVIVVGRSGRVWASSDGERFTAGASGLPAELLRVQRIGDQAWAVGQLGAALRRDRPIAATQTLRTASKAVATAQVVTIAWPTPDPHARSDEAIQKALDARGTSPFLHLDARGLTSLRALASASDLTDLSIWGPAPDLTPLRHLTQLRSLTLYGSARSLEPLTRLPALAHLTLRGTHRDLEPLTRCPALTRLDLLRCRQPDLAPLAALKALDHLGLPSSARNLSALTQLSQLKHLDLHATPDLLAEAALPVDHLTLRASRIDDLNAVAHLTSLRSLSVHGVQSSLTDLSPLADLADLEHLTISRSQLTDLAPLQHLSQLKLLALTRAPLCDLTPLSALAALETLVLTGCRELRSLTGLEGLSALRRLDLQKTRARDLTPLAALTGLQHLDLGNTGVTDLGPLAGHAALTSVDLRGTRVTSIEPLRAAAALTSLDLTHTRVTDLTPLEDLRALTQLSAERLGVVTGAAALGRLEQLSWLRVGGTTFDPRVLNLLPQLRYVHGCAWPAAGADLTGPPPGPRSDALGPGLVLDGRFGLARLEGGHLHDLDLSNDGALIAAALRSNHGGAPGVHVLRTVDASVVATFGAEGLCEGVAFSGDGASLYFTQRTWQGSNDLTLWKARLDDGSVEQVLTLPRPRFCRLARDRSASRLALLSSLIDVLDTATGTLRPPITTSDTYNPPIAAFSHTAPRLWIWGLDEERIVALDLETGERGASVPAPYKGGAGLTLSSDDALMVAVGGTGYGISALDTATGERLRPEVFQLQQHQGAAVITPDGSLVVHLHHALRALRPRGGEEPVEGPNPRLSYHANPAAVAVAWDAPMVAFGMVSWREAAQPLVWAPLRP